MNNTQISQVPLFWVEAENTDGVVSLQTQFQKSLGHGPDSLSVLPESVVLF